jgi:FAD/FMN-containing dehydrogenases
LAQARLGCSLTGFELMSAHSLQLVQQHFPQLALPFELPSAWCVLLESSETEGEPQGRARLESLLETALNDGLIVNAAVAQSLAQSRALWHLRESIPLAQAQEGLNIKHDIGVPLSRMVAFVESTAELVTQALPGARLVVFGHLGDGNLHYNVQAPVGVDAARFWPSIKPFATASCTMPRWLAAERSRQNTESASSKRDDLARYGNPVALAQMRALKQALDPQNLMNPGKMWPG